MPKGRPLGFAARARVADDGRGRRWVRWARVTTVFTTLVASLGVVTAPPVAAQTPAEINAAQAIVSFLSDTVAGLADFDELGQAIPGTDLVPTSVPGLDLVNVLQGIANEISTVPDKTADAVEAELEGITAIGSVDVAIEVEIDTGAGTITFDTLELSRAVSTPVAFASGDPGTADFFSLEGGSYGGDISLDLAPGTGSLVLALDTTGDPGALAGLVMPVPDTVFSADLELTGTFGARLGILDVTAAPGTVGDPAASASLAVTVGWLDPDSSGTITVDELVGAAPSDLFQAAISGGEVHLDVELSAGLTGLAGVTGTVTLDDTDLTNGLSAPSFQLGELGNFTNFTPQDVLAALAQLAVSMRGLQLKLGNLDLPLLDENLAELGNWSDRISKLFTDNGLAVAGNPVDLDVTADKLETAGFETLEGIIAELETTLGLAAGALGLAYQPADDTVTFTIDVDDDAFFHQTPEAKVNVADELKKAGITGLVLDGGASLTMDPTYSLDLTVGLDLSDALSDPATPITDRIFLEIGDGDELALDVPISADLDLKGTIGFLQIDLEAVDGPVDLLAPADAAKPMLAIDIATTGEDDRLTLTELFDATGSIALTEPSPGPGVFELDLGGGTTIRATANVGVPTFTMAASSSLPGLENVAGAELTFGWANLFVGEPTVTTTGSFDDSFLSFNLDNEDPLALFATILQGVEMVFGTLASLDQQANDAGALMNEELPVVGTSLEDALAFIADVREALNALSQDPSASVQQLELQANAVIAAALDELDGTVDLVLPELPEPEDFVSVVDGDEQFDSDGYSDAVNQYLTDLQAFVNDSADFLGISYVPGNSPGTLKLDFDIGVCSDKATHPGCVFELPISKPFNLDLGEFGGGLIGGETNGEVGVDYGVVLSADFGIQLPEVTTNPSGLPTIGGPPQLFIYETSGITADIEGFAEGEMSATVGPFEVQVGDDTGIAETACDDDVDDDGDGKVNDGCAAVDISEAGIDGACDNDVDDEEDLVEDDPATEDVDESVPADGKVNDGCAATGNPFEARAGVALSLTNDLGADERTSDFGAYFAGLTGDVTPNADCGSGAVLACADLPVYVGLTDGPEYLGTIAFTQADFDTAPSLTGADTVFANLKSKAESFLWQLIGDGIVEFGNYVERSLSAGEYGAEIPVVGDLVDAGAEVGAAFNQNIAAPVGNLVGSLNSSGDFGTVRSAIRDFFWNQIGPSGANLLLNADDVVDDGDPSQATAPVKEDDIVVTLRCGNDAHVCVESGDTPDDFLDLADVQVELKMGQVGGAATPAFDFGVPGLRLSGGDGTVSSTVTWQLNVGFGIGLTDGFYLLTDTAVDDVDATDGSGAGDELSLSADVDLGTPIGSGGDPAAVPDPANAALQGDIAFIGVDVFNAKDDRLDDGDDGRKGHEVHIELSVDIPDPGPSDTRLGLSELVTGLDPTDWDVQLAASIDLYVTLLTSIDIGSGDPAAIPRLLADLSLTWEITGDLTDGIDYTDLTVGFDNVRLDLGSFIAEFLNPVLSEIQRFTKPLQPIIDTLQAPIPGVAQLAELIGTDPPTLLDLMEAMADSDLTVIKRLLDVVSFANALPTVQPGDTSLLVPLGGFDLDSSALAEPELPANKKGDLISSADDPANVFESSQFGDLDSEFGAKFDESTGSEGGFSFPAFEEPSQLFGLIVGENPTLVRFDAGTLRAEVSQSFTFGPITVGPIPVSVVVSVGAAVEGRFAMGYDTKGIRQMVQNLTDGDTGNDGFFENLGVLFAGVFIDDLDAAGNDVPEIRLILEAAVGAAVDLVIVKAGVEAGVRATLDLNLHDGGFTNPIPPENLDGKLRIDEIIQILAGNPICLFDVSGKLEAFIRLFVTIDLFLFSATFKQTIVNLVLLELDNITAELCEPPPPVLAAPDGNVLVLNMGERAGERNYDEGNKDEKFVVRQLSDGASGVKVSVTAFGIVQEYEGIDKVVGSGADGKDSITTEQGAISGICQSDGSVDPPIGIGCDGGTPSDPSDDAEAGETVTKLIPFGIPVSFCGGAGPDSVGGGTVADELFGDGKLSGADCVANDSGADEADKVTGGAGDDDIWGDVGDDDLNGESGDDEIWGGAGADQITGGIGKDQLRGEGEADLILGGPEEDPCTAGDDADRDLCSDAADDKIWGGAGGDSIEGDHGKDQLHGEGEDDVVVAGLGDDTATGGDGHDQLFGNQGHDTLGGDAGDDDLLGGDGDDTLNGGADEDDIVGENGADTVDGGTGWDIVLGDVGTVNRAPDDSATGDAFNLADLNRPLVELIPSADAGGDDLAGGADPDRIWGQEGDDDIHGNAGDDVVRGNTGQDTISGDEGGDELHGDEDDDTIHGDDPTGSHGAGDGVDTARGGGGDDVIEGNAAGDKLFGDSGRDQVFGDAEVEATCGIDGADVIRGGPDGDHLFGNADADQIFGEGGHDRIVGGSDTADVCDGGDTIVGGMHTDVIAGDNATIGDAPLADDMLVTLLLDGDGAGDVVNGDGGDASAADDRIFGQHGTDTLNGDGGDDYVEGNGDVDTISGGAGNDDLIGGSSAADGVIDDDRIGDGQADAGDAIAGDAGLDWITGDNAIIVRNVPEPARAASRVPIELFDVGKVGAAAPLAGASGVDVIDGGTETDRIFGQGKGDTIAGGAGDDYVEGNDGDDAISGQAGDDDLIGGGSAFDGVIDDDRVGTDLLDTGETLVSGGAGQDWITGDNAIIVRNIPAPGRAADHVPIELFDVELAGGDERSPLASGGDFLRGDADEDRIFGQGNGAQPATQLDPADGRNNDFVATGGDVTDPDFHRATGTADEDGDAAGEWLGDIVWGGTGDDEIEGGHGNDLVYGNAPDGHADTEVADPDDDEDDIVGGGSADDGVIDGDRLNVGAGLLDGADVVHGDEGLVDAGDDDVILGDNGWITRTGAVQAGDGPEQWAEDPDGVGPIEEGDPIAVSIPVRTTQTGLAPAAGTFGDDHLLGNGGHDDVIGQAGDDALEGEWGSDGILGDLGTITVDLLGNGGPPDLCGDPHVIEPKEPFISEEACTPGTLFRRVQLVRFDDTQSNVVQGDDVILGGDGDDWLHGGPGLDLMQGDGDADPATEVMDPDTKIESVDDPNPNSEDFDRIFGGDSNQKGETDDVQLGDGDNLWGGRGHDHLYGGHGADNHDVRPVPGDPAEPYPDTWFAWAAADAESYHGVDYIYGGHGPDAMQGNVADNGPVTGDRLMDWAGVFNLSLLCPATYGAYVTIRDMSPDLIEYWEESADADGAHQVTTPGSSGRRELAMVYKPDVKANNNPPYPNTPGHFFACAE